ncbi:substrate-binding domain-containing protein [Enterococcus timonensis]|uniref:substrate-binding domain-containing protein n=1 Tax=Enterococcus timonensis TaxID=1852364 RepID=UPI0008DAA8D9|nr:substrate-binding domain-containing protein [Enterococcus timonensis]
MKWRKFLPLIAGAALILGACGNKSKASATSEKADGGAISVVTREEGSGTRGAFIELFGLEEKNAAGEKIDHTSTKAEVTNSTSVMLTTVAGNKNALGYVSLGSLTKQVKAVKIDGVLPTVETVKDGSYTISRPFNIVQKKTDNPVAQEFVAFILSKEGQAVVEKNGYISKGADKNFMSVVPAGKITVAGSSSITPVMEKLKEAYLEINAKATIDIQQSDSSTGVSATQDGVADIGMVSRELKDTEKGLQATVIALDGIAVIVNPDQAKAALTKDDVKAIYSGDTTDWGNIK